MTINPEKDRFGSAKWASPEQVQRAGLYGPRGLFLGFFEGRPLHLESDAPLITIGGAGSGKLRDILAYNICGHSDTASTFRLDPKGELTAISIQNSVRHGKAHYVIILQHINFMADPALQETFGPDPDFSLDLLAQVDSSADVSLIVPVENIAIWKPAIRGVIGAAMLYKYRAPAAPTTVFFIDEAAQLGHFEALLRAYNFGRGGAKIRCWTFWQDTGQITRNYGPTGIASFFGSSQVRQICGPPRDLDTARLVEAMCGSMTLT